jgi:hypothetical protein
MFRWSICAALLVVVLGTRPAAAQNPLLYFSFKRDPTSTTEMVRVLRLRPHVRTEVFLQVYNPDETPAENYTVELRDGDTVVASAPVEVGKKGIKRVSFGPPPPPPKDPKAPPLPLTEAKGPLTVRLMKGKAEVKNAGVSIDVASPREYVDVKPQPIFKLVPVDEGKENGEGPREGIFEVRLLAKSTFYGTADRPSARVELVILPERVPDLLPGQRKYGSYGGDLVPGEPLVLRAERLKFREGKLGKGLIYLTIDGYPRAFTYVSSFVGSGESQAQEVKAPVLRLLHARFAKPGEKFPVTVEADNIPPPDKAFGSLAIFRVAERDDDGNIVKLSGRDGLPRIFDGDRTKTILFSPKGPAEAMVLDSKVADHKVIFDTTSLHGARYLAASVLERAEGNPPLTVLNSKLMPEFGQDLKKAGTKVIVEQLVTREGGPENVTLGLALPFPPPGRLPELLVGAPLPLKATAEDPTGVVKAVFFLGKPPPGNKLPPTMPQAEGERAPGNPNIWLAELPAPTQKAAFLLVGVQVTNGVGETTTEVIKVQLVDPKAAAEKKGPEGPRLSTITGKVLEGDRGAPNVPVTLGDAKGELKAATRTNAAGVFKFEDVPPGAYTVNAARSASRTTGRSLVSVPQGKKDVVTVDVKLTR